MGTAIARPDLSNRPLSCSCERLMAAPARTLFEAWTTGFDRWFAAPGTLRFTAAPGAPFFFYNRIEWGRHPHYGRVLALVPDRSIELAWVTGNGRAEGTEGAETILTITLEPQAAGTLLRLDHRGFVNEASRRAHADNWPLALDELAARVGA
ncbi:SRPBCC family protein [Sphingomicrobium astaxanthinifaciens]|uniref:SRPBCC family protein n=1 Tax=Sphingomicrobium astaxanthinifaciens TaxID=1227949 RepID=UPI001FCCBE74|nr:SRPBCC domain-containing protein [Sphingomicrobium astaxanthinifaciens]MCJ7420721.1 SRPBCC domain-containing protein [Sphingomicrobium astaxanthinifaciens]